jgi:hypothetical protein
MTTPVLPSSDLGTVDGLLVQALADLRSARLRCARGGSREAVLDQERAESNLNALLDYRCVAVRRGRSGA